jgi:hypothetical protein
MKIYNYKEKFEKTGVQDESFYYTICDLFCHLKCKDQWLMAILSSLITLCVFFFTDLSYCQLNKITDICLSVFPSTLGLSIAAYAIVIGFQSDTLKYLLKKDNKKVKPFHVICASMIFNGMLQTFTIIVSFVYQLCNNPTLFYILTFLGCYSIIQILDILLQLLGLRTFVIHFEEVEQKER